MWFPFLRDPGQKSPLVQFNSYRWYVFHKFGSVQQKSSCKASWKRRKYFNIRYFYFIYFLTLAPMKQCGNIFISLLFSRTNQNTEGWRSHVFIREASALLNLLLQNIERQCQTQFGENGWLETINHIAWCFCRPTPVVATGTLLPEKDAAGERPPGLGGRFWREPRQSLLFFLSCSSFCLADVLVQWICHHS